MIRPLAIVACLLLAAPESFAGRTCEEQIPSIDSLRMADRTAVRVREVLDGSPDIEVALLGRVGSDISNYGLRYTHAGVVVRKHPKGPWLSRHLLNHCDSSQSSIFDQGLMTFYLDSPHAYDTLVLVPTAELQHKLARLVVSDTALQLHHPAYSTLAYPFSLRYQNSNQWLLELVAVARRPDAVSRSAAQEILRETGFRPSMVALGPLTRLGASVFRVNVRFDDHPAQEDWSNRFSVVSVKSLEDYLRDTGQLARRFVIPAPANGIRPRSAAGGRLAKTRFDDGPGHAFDLAH